MKSHIENVHKDPQYCNFCDAVFAVKSNLIDHIGTVHDHLKPEKCSICDNYFSENVMKNHMKSVHKGVLSKIIINQSGESVSGKSILYKSRGELSPLVIVVISK